MFTTGSKLLFGIAALALGAALIFLLTADESVLFAFPLLVSLAGVSAFLGGVVISYRDADVRVAAVVASSATDAEGTMAPGTSVAPSGWPFVAALGAALAVLGLVTDNRYFVGGLAVLAVAVIEWMVVSWSDRASGDPEYNRALRDRLMHPIEFPVAGLAIAGLVIYGFSRVMLAISRNASFVAFGGIAVLVLVVGIVVATRPQIGRGVVSAVLVVGGLATLAGGIAAAVHGERSFDEGRAAVAPKRVSNPANPIATVTAGSGGFDIDQIQVAKGLTGNIVFRNNAGEAASFVIDGRYKDDAGKDHGQLFQTNPVRPGGSGLVTFRLTRSGSYPYTALGVDGKTIATGTLTVP